MAARIRVAQHKYSLVHIDTVLVRAPPASKAGVADLQAKGYRLTGAFAKWWPR
jgi:hypothetical protein